MRRPFAHLSMLLAAACGTADRSPGSDTPTPDTGQPYATIAPGHATPPAVEAFLVDSVPYENELADGVLRRVAVRAAGRVDTLPGILAAAAPVVVGDSVVVGVQARENLVEGLYAHDVRTRQTRMLPAPPDWVPHAVPELSPDGRHLAYLTQAPTGEGHGVVATVPAGRVVYRGPPATMLETDAGVDAVRWEDAGRFAIRIDLTYRVGGTQRLRGTVAPLHVVVDTVRPTPR
ncbi:MAG: hypothetical protein ACXW61_04730 [Gemmatirosa sp.]